MMLAKNWYRRRAAAGALLLREAANLNVVVVLDFYAVDLEAVCEHGTYYVERVGSDWAVRFRPKDALWEARDVHIDAIDAEGGALDWPTRDCAIAAAKMHANLLGLGHSVGRATQLVAERSQRVAEHQREATLDYAEARP